MEPLKLIDKAVEIIDKHLDQIRIGATRLTKDGIAGFSTYDSQVVERYTKLLLVMTKQASPEQDETDSLSDEELKAQARTIIEGQGDAASTSEPE